jgi:uncharacterized protein YjbI with pentapeptide repeats
VSETSCGRPHYAVAPDISAFEPENQTPLDCDGDVHDLWLKDTRILELELDRPEFLDVRLEDCDLSAVTATGFIARRVELRNTRVRGVTLVKGQYDDGLVVDCATSDLSLRFSRLRRVVFRDCDLSGADFYNATFEHVTFDDCNLQRARFDGAIVKCLAITNCNLAAISGVSGLRGAQLDASDLPGLAQSLAADAGILIRDA